MDALVELALCIKAAQRELDRRANDALRPLGLTGPQADALTIIGHAQPISLKELGELLIAEAGHPSRMVDRLVNQGLVERREAQDDRRRIVLSLTAKGRRLEQKAEKARQEILDLARLLIADREIEPVVEFMRDMLKYSSFTDLLDRRRELLGGHAAPGHDRQTR